ncbi:MAG: Uma2 family endonuclease [Chloroflexi bacterium]|nr:Uma2 family endonuclease [Chloroflexota bacterium]
MTTTSEKMPTPADNVPGPLQGHWTYSHYAALSDDGQRYEILDGVLYLMPPSPSPWHQKATTRLSAFLVTHIEFAGLGEVFSGPLDVELAPDVVVQPDILVVLKDNCSKIISSHIVGAPDLVVEVASPSTAKYDRRKKYNAYAHAGVREYWIIDPIKCTIEVLILEAGTYHSAGVFRGDDLLPSLVVPRFPVRVKQIFK